MVIGRDIVEQVHRVARLTEPASLAYRLIDFEGETPAPAFTDRVGKLNRIAGIHELVSQHVPNQFATHDSA
jgi:hypothetical protein